MTDMVKIYFEAEKLCLELSFDEMSRIFRDLIDMEIVKREGDKVSILAKPTGKEGHLVFIINRSVISEHKTPATN